jgi:hypothetical protein
LEYSFHQQRNTHPGENTQGQAGKDPKAGITLIKGRQDSKAGKKRLKGRQENAQRRQARKYSKAGNKWLP